ncbi:MAG: outer membrane protein OmpA [Ferruginibacter sp.]|nr:outer membrane protein OmpA [Ferruginibacter sp.]
MSFFNMSKTATSVALLLLSATALQAQQKQAPQPKWLFGASAAANFNFFQGTTQMLNASVTTPTAFHKGNGIRPYASLLAEFHPNKVLGAMLNVAYDNRGGEFNTVTAPCDCPADLKTNLSYVNIEPSLRLAPFASSFYVFAGPVIGLNVSNKFTYEQEKQTTKTGEWSDTKKTVVSAQAGMGMDFDLSAPASNVKTILSPFVSFQSNLGRDPRATESWSVYTVRAGLAYKFGRISKGSKSTATVNTAVVVTTPAVVAAKAITLNIQTPAPSTVTVKVKETFPFRNSVFFNMGSSDIPARYTQLSTSQAAAFREGQLQELQPTDLSNGRSSRQLAVYHHILNILGDRLRSNPAATIKLTGASEKNPVEGKLMADNISGYLVNNYGINPSRITTAGRDRPLIPSEQPGAVNDIALLREGDRRVDIESASPEMLMQVGGAKFLKPVQLVENEQKANNVIFTVQGATETLKSWSVDITDSKAVPQHYGPYTATQASIPVKTILGKNLSGEYNITMNGTRNDGTAVQQKDHFSILKSEIIQQEGLRYSILFDFDQSKSIAAYEKFLTDVVTPLIPANGKVIIHGHTDVIGEELYNQNLSKERADGAQRIIEKALSARGTKGVTFQTTAYGEDGAKAPFENNLPEERFYNRTVVIDIFPGK